MSEHQSSSEVGAEASGPAGSTLAAVAAFAGALPGRVVETDLTAFDRAGAAVWSVALLDPPRGGGVGYGPDADTARASAYGELVESVRSHAVLTAAAPRRASWADLRAAGEEATDPRTLILPAGSDWTPQTPLGWLQAQRLRDGAGVWVPVDFLASDPGDLPAGYGRPLTTPVTNGLGAGLDADRAVAHAVLEVAQRDGNGLVFRALDRGVVLDLAALTDPAALHALAQLRAAGVEPLVKLASTAFDLVDVYAVGEDTGAGADPLASTCIGEACHPDRQVAVRKALLELCSSRARKAFAFGDLDRVRALAGDAYLDAFLAALPDTALDAEEPRVLAATVAWLRTPPERLAELLRPTILSARTRVALADLPTTPVASTAALREDVVGRLHAAGFDVLVLDLSGDGVAACKVVVPGLEVETMSYGRIGERGVRRALELGLPFVAVGADPGGWSPVLLSEDAQERLGGPAWLDRGGKDAVIGELYPLYREPGRHVARLAMARQDSPGA